MQRSTRSIDQYAEKIYAGVLGKIIGVYMGRPVEGWPYSDIQARFDEITHYVHANLGLPLIIADDDISGTFGFFRAIEDNNYASDVSARNIGDTWLNYIIENKTILWWGGLGRSTEHTAYLRLKAGVPAPRSGSAALNGRTLSEQIGAQIFIDGFAMMHPGDPDRAAALVREAASVSHDGLAVEAAAFLGAMEALAFDVPAVEDLIENCRRYVASPFLNRVIDDVLSICSRESDWRRVRSWLDERYGYDKFAGPCHIVPNHAMVLASLLLGKDDFQRALMIATSAGWDTDCNAGSVGCLNAIRLGLNAITAQVDFRTPVADRLLVVTADGGSCVSDAVQQARSVVRAAARVRGENVCASGARFAFEYRGSTQGFGPCPYLVAPYPNVSVDNLNGLVLDCRAIGPGITCAVSTPVFIDPSDRGDNFSTLASPTLYPGQLVQLRARVAGAANPTLHLYVLHQNVNGEIQPCFSPPFALRSETDTLTWRIPSVGLNPLIRFGVQVESASRFDGRVIVEEINWSGAPERFEQAGVLMSSIWDTRPAPLRAWVSSAQNFEADFKYTYSVSHPVGSGLATIGTRDWADYAIQSTLIFNLHRSAGLVVRSIGHRRYYAAVFSDGSTVKIVKRTNADTVTLAETTYAYQEDLPYTVMLECTGPCLRLVVNGDCLLEAVDDSQPFTCGAAGFVIEEGTVLADGFLVEAR
jgi:ADP-ribosylglycohydrolase